MFYTASYNEPSSYTQFFTSFLAPPLPQYQLQIHQVNIYLSAILEKKIHFFWLSTVQEQ